MRVADIAAATDKWLGDCANLSAAECQANCAYITDRCDGARSQDGAGWGRYDRATGTLLARRPADRWSADDLRRGRRLSHKYRKQLASRPPLDELLSPAAASMQRLMGADSIEVIDADAMEDTNGQKQATPASQRSVVGNMVADVAPEVVEPGTPVVAAVQLDDSQRAALDLIRRSRIAVLTGGPGTGKTTITQQVVHEALTDGRRVAAMAPTGIAASRLQDSIDFPATTIHRALGAIPEGESLRIVQPDQAEALRAADLVVVDEMSMVTSQLLNHLRRAVKPDAQVLMIGDPDQLAPVGSGQPFTDLIDAGAVPVARLATVHRQAHGSRILEACDLVRAGRWYDAAPQADRDDDLVWLEEESEELLADMCEELLVQLRQRYEAAEVTLVTPRVTGGTAGNVQLRTEELNRRLQRRLNPAAGLGGIAVGDPVICGKNRPADGVWNGTGGTAVMDNEKLQLRVHDAEGRLVDCIEDCELAYAISVHRYQGSQNRVIVVAAHPSGGKTLTRRLLYTAISRAQERCYCLGPGAAFVTAAQTAPKRATLLRGLLEARPRIVIGKPGRGKVAAALGI